MLFQDRSSSNNTTVCHIIVPKGTFAYIDPEFLQTGEHTTKSDVYSFGVILLQLFTSRPAFLIANEVKRALEAGNFEALLDPLAGNWPIELAQELAWLALWCCDRNRKSRPALSSDIWKVLIHVEPQSSCRLGPEEKYSNHLYSGDTVFFLFLR